MEIEIGRLFRAIRRFWWVPIAVTILLGLVAGMVSNTLSNSYTSTARMLIVPDTLAGDSMIGGSPNLLIDIATSTPVLDEVIQDLNLDMTVAELRGSTSALMQTGTRMLLISVTHEDPQLAAEIANTIALKTEARSIEITTTELSAKRDELQFRSDQLRDRLTSIDTRISILEEAVPEDGSQRDAELVALREERLAVAQLKVDVDSTLRVTSAQIARVHSDVSIVEEARVPEEPDGLSPVISAIVGAFVGGLIGSALILLMAVRDNTVVNGAQVARITGAPILREVGRKTTAHDLRMALSFISGLRSVDPGSSGSISIVAPTELPQLRAQETGEEGSASALAMTDGMHVANGVMAHEAALSSALQSSGVVLATAVGSTSESDLRTTVDSLTVAGIPILGSILFSER